MDIPANLSAAYIAKLRLIHAAIRLFSAKGIEGVSLRLVNREAGNRNNSALHYHFGDKLGLITATITYIQDWFENTREVQLKALEQKSKSEPVSVAEVINVLIDPYVRLLESESWGHDALCALARFELDSENGVHEVLNNSSGKVARRLRSLLAKACPDTPRKLLNERLNMCLFMSVQGFANYKNHHRSYMGNLNCSYRVLGEQFKSFCIAGVVAD